MLTGVILPWHLLAFWVFAVSALGVVVAAGLRNQMLLRERLPFPAGVATAETMKQIHGRGGEATARLRVLGGGALVSGALKLAGELAGGLPRLAPSVVPARARRADAGQSRLRPRSVAAHDRLRRHHRLARRPVAAVGRGRRLGLARADDLHARLGQGWRGRPERRLVRAAGRMAAVAGRDHDGGGGARVVRAVAREPLRTPARRVGDRRDRDRAASRLHRRADRGAGARQHRRDRAVRRRPLASGARRAA